ncbi:MAG: hypothetical protein R3A78_02055 [Polyangiales bacterium]
MRLRRRGGSVSIEGAVVLALVALAGAAAFEPLGRAYDSTVATGTRSSNGVPSANGTARRSSVAVSASAALVSGITSALQFADLRHVPEVATRVPARMTHELENVARYVRDVTRSGAAEMAVELPDLSLSLHDADSRAFAAALYREVALRTAQLPDAAFDAALDTVRTATAEGASFDLRRGVDAGVPDALLARLRDAARVFDEPRSSGWRTPAAEAYAKQIAESLNVAEEAHIRELRAPPNFAEVPEGTFQLQDAVREYLGDTDRVLQLSAGDDPPLSRSAVRTTLRGGKDAFGPRLALDNREAGALLRLDGGFDYIEVRRGMANCCIEGGLCCGVPASERAIADFLGDVSTKLTPGGVALLHGYPPFDHANHLALMRRATATFASEHPDLWVRLHAAPEVQGQVYQFTGVGIHRPTLDAPQLHALD